MLVSLTSCTKALQTGTPIPDSGPTISEIYDAHAARKGPFNAVRRQLHDGDHGLHGYTRDVYDELSVRFPRLPNPTIVMYVFPHLSQEGTPVPGYSTMFPLYEAVKYALPGELNEQ